MKWMILLLASLTGAFAQATTFHMKEAVLSLRTSLILDSAVTYVSCTTDNLRGNDPQEFQSRYKVAVLSPMIGGYTVTIPENTVDFKTFGRKFGGCDLVLTQITGMDPESNVPLESTILNELILGSSRESTTDSSELIKATEAFLVSCALKGTYSQDSRESRPTWFSN